MIRDFRFFRNLELKKKKNEQALQILMLEVKPSASIWKFKQKLIENPSLKCSHLDVIFL